MKTLEKYIANPIKSSSEQSLEKMERKEYNKVNTLFRLNLNKIIKSKECKEKQIIYCIQGRMYY